MKMQSNQKRLSVGFLFDDTLDSHDGVAQYVKTVGSWLTQNDHHVTYLVGESKINQWAGGEVYSLSKNLPIAWGGNRLSMPLLPKLKLMREVLGQKKFDVIHVQVPYSPFMAQLVINSIDSGTAVVGTVHIFPANHLAFFGSKVLKKIYGKSFKRFDKFLSVSSAAQTYAKQVFKMDSEVVPNVIDLTEFRTQDGRRRPGKEIVFLGRLVPRKGCQELLKAFKLLAETVPEAYLTIAGDGPLRGELKKFVEGHHLEDRVKFLGFISEEEKPRLLASADIACFPSLYGESFGIVLIEAMAAGAGVVVGGNNPGYASVLGENSGALVNPGDSVEFATVLEKILTDRSLSERLHRQQQEQVKQYDVGEVGAQLLQIYSQAIASRHQKP